MNAKQPKRPTGGRVFTVRDLASVAVLLRPFDATEMPLAEPYPAWSRVPMSIRLDVAGERFDESHDVPMTADDARKLATALLNAASVVDGQQPDGRAVR